jgi:hypothetical protein
MLSHAAKLWQPCQLIAILFMVGLNYDDAGLTKMAINFVKIDSS